ncbi:MAG: PrsW family intramembrane metalloprotease [Bacteroidetes bacterium]|nr:PrsW family intramembrane metalloprotease [Bacteroidota bacterium]
MLISLLAVSAVVPSALLVWYFHARDVYPEPPRVLWTTFGLGVLTVLPILLIGIPLQGAVQFVGIPILQSLLSALFVAALPEELVKLIVLLGYNLRHKAFDEPMDGIVYGVVASLGFATLENVLFVFEGGLSVAISRAFSAVPLHAFVGAIMGYYVGQAYFSEGSRSQLILKGYGAAVLLHTLYDFPLMAMGEVEDARVALLLAVLTVAVLFVCWRWTVRLVRRLRRDQLSASDAEGGVVPGFESHAMPLPMRQRAIPLFVAVMGGLLASFGGMVSLGLLLAFVLGGVQVEHTADVLVGGGLIGLLPLAGGMVMFLKGVRRMNSANRREGPVPLAAPSQDPGEQGA